ncbi:hypothetical protein Aoc01nite_36020 [Actinoplanes octamycinicus]|nr:hypothetical protein Aoc01nite_36020 [Actinoplanes octamycinicus]
MGGGRDSDQQAPWPGAQNRNKPRTASGGRDGDQWVPWPGAQIVSGTGGGWRPRQ